MIAGIDALVDLDRAILQDVDLPILAEKKCVMNVLRIDKIHATISGNKWFKLKYNLQHAISSGKDTVVTAGGAYSNHLVATAWACSQLNLTCIGIVRGERPDKLSPTLLECEALGMELHFASRESYTKTKKIFTDLGLPNACFIEEGGRNHLGVKGASEILALVQSDLYSHICCASGTGTMMAGLVNGAAAHQQVTGFSSLKLSPGNDIETFIAEATGHRKNYSINYDYHFGGYARKTNELIDFMNTFFRQTGIPTDLVYTAKLFYGLTNLLANDHFGPGSRILVIHSGGLQGNRSLPKNTLVF